MKKIIFICLFCFFIIGCDNNNSLTSCPIAQNELVESSSDIVFPSDIYKLPTLEKYFNRVLTDINNDNRFKASISWEKIKDNYYIFTMVQKDIIANSTDILKMGVRLYKSGHVAITDYWLNNNHLQNVGVNPTNYFLAVKDTKSTIENKIQNSFVIQLGNYTAEDYDMLVTLNENGKGVIKDVNNDNLTFKWKQENSEINFQILDEDVRPSRKKLKAIIVSETSFNLEGRTFILNK